MDIVPSPFPWGDAILHFYQKNTHLSCVCVHTMYVYIYICIYIYIQNIHNLHSIHNIHIYIYTYVYSIHEHTHMNTFHFFQTSNFLTLPQIFGCSGAPNLLHLRVVRWRNTIEVGCNLRAQILGFCQRPNGDGTVKSGARIHRRFSVQIFTPCSTQ